MQSDHVARQPPPGFLPGPPPPVTCVLTPAVAVHAWTLMGASSAQLTRASWKMSRMTAPRRTAPVPQVVKCLRMGR
jgi:hypothetical protein